MLFELQGEGEKNHTLHHQTKQLLAQKQGENSHFLGIMGKCMIDGCDVHTLTTQGDIIEHFPVGEPTAPIFTRAREALSQATSNTVGVLVYDDRIEMILLDGTIRRG
jgi:hypothetical protein